MESGARRPELPEPQWETVVETRRDVAAVPIAADSELARRSSDRPAELERTLSGPPELVSSPAPASRTRTTSQNVVEGLGKNVAVSVSNFIDVCIACTFLVCVNLYAGLDHDAFFYFIRAFD